MEDKEFRELEKQIEEAKKHNQKLFIEFGKWLEKKSLKSKTINKHVDNIEVFGNDYLLRYEIIPVEKGALEIGGYLGDFFIRKAGWASKNSIKENITSFKKFYTFLNEIEMVSKSELNEMKAIIKVEKSIWIEEVENYLSDIEDDWW